MFIELLAITNEDDSEICAVKVEQGYRPPSIQSYPAEQFMS